MGSTVVKKSLEKREEENHKTSQVDEKNNILVDSLEIDNRMEKGKIKRLEETQKRERRKNEDLQKEPLASHIMKGKWNDALYEACKIGNKEIVELMIEKGANDWNKGLYGACEGGNKEIIELMIEKGADDWNYGLIGACRGGYKEIVGLMIEKGADNLNEGLQIACIGGYKEIAKIMKQKGGNNDRYHSGCNRLCNDGSILF